MLTLVLQQRQDIIDNFNNSPNKDIMLLSARVSYNIFCWKKALDR